MDGMGIELRVARLERAVATLALTITREYRLVGGNDHPGVKATREILAETQALDGMAAAAARRDALRAELEAIEVA